MLLINYKTTECHSSLIPTFFGSVMYDIQKYLRWLKLNNAKKNLSFKLPKKYAYWNPLYLRGCCWKKDMFSFQIESSHVHIGLKWLCQPEIGYTTLHFFQINTPTITLTWHCSSTMVRGHEKQSDSNTYLHLHQYWHQLCLQTGTLHHLAKWQVWYTICWDNWGTKTTN